MYNNYINDIKFLQELDNMKIHETLIKLVLLDFNENPIKDIQGSVMDNGSLSINGAAGIRRTISFNMLVS